jgi:hypothetical protein
MFQPFEAPARGVAMRIRRFLALVGCATAAAVLTSGLAATPAGAGTAKINLLRPFIAAHGAAAPAVRPNGIIVSYSSNWSGYAALPKQAGQTFTSVVGSYTVPSVDCSKTPNTFSYHWIGLDGWSDATVEQDGIAADCHGPKARYAAWYEMYPANFSFDFAVHPGDAIESAVQYLGGKRYELTLKDVTSGKSFDLTQTCPVATCENSSAEAITEGYYYNKRFAGTSDFGDEHYANVTVSDSNGNIGGLADHQVWKTGEGIALGRYGDVDTTPGPLANSGGFAPSSSFSVYWSRQD